MRKREISQIGFMDAMKEAMQRVGVQKRMLVTR